MRFKFEIRFDGTAFRQAVTGPVSRLIREVVSDLRVKFVELFKDPKTGRIYPRPGGGTYRASAPGEPPAIRTRNLMESISESFPDPLTGVITISAPYAADLEEGTQRVAARPFVRPAIESVTEKFNSGVRSRF